MEGGGIVASKQYIPYDRFYKPKDRVRVARFLVSRSRNPQERAYSILDFLQWAKVIPQQPLGIRSTGRFAFPSASRRFLGVSLPKVPLVVRHKPATALRVYRMSDIRSVSALESSFVATGFRARFDMAIA